MNRNPERFGRLRPPSGGLHPGESSRPPRFCHGLDTCADWLRELVSLPLGNPIFHVLAKQLNILWVVDAGGIIQVAIEELLLDDHPGLARGEIVILPRQMSLPYRPRKLGHGSMLRGADGRIGGEICVQRMENGKPGWELNNWSGRYGRQCGRTPEQLQAVVDEFAQRKINLEVRFYE